MVKKLKFDWQMALIVFYAVFVLFSLLFPYSPKNLIAQKVLSAGKGMALNFWSFLIYMIKILPFAFVLIGLFEVWVKRETIVRHMGRGSGARGYFWAILLAGTTVGGILVAFPIAYTLYHKGAKLSVIFTYIGASAVCRVPMTIFEASFLGIKFSLVRLFCSIPLIIFSSIILADYFEKRGYEIKAGK